MQKENLKNIDWHGEATKLSLENRLFITVNFAIPPMAAACPWLIRPAEKIVRLRRRR